MAIMSTLSRPRPFNVRPASMRASYWLLAAAIAGSALALGTVNTVTLCVVSGVLAVAAVLGWWHAEPGNARSGATLLLVTGAILTAYTALQCLPMPTELLAVVAPHNADVWSRALAPLHEPGPRWATISEDPSATRVEVLKGISYMLAFIAALRAARQREGVAFLSLAIISTGVVEAAAALVHPAFGIRKLYGVYEPGPGVVERHLAPLMNPNNLAGYLNLSFCLALAVMLMPEPRVPRPIMAAVVLVVAVTQIWIASRSGVVAMVLGATVVIGIARFVRRKRGGSPAQTAVFVVPGVAAAIGAAMIVLGSSDEASNELLVTDTSKLHMLWRMMHMLPAVPISGRGRGAFESAYPLFRTDVGHVTYTHPENFVAQWILEWGLPVGVAALVAVAFALRPDTVLARSTTASGAWAGLVAVAVQNLSDLGTEIPGLMIAAVVCGAIVVAGTPGYEPRTAVGRWAYAPKRVAIAAGVLATVGIVLGFISLSAGELHRDQLELRRAALERRVSAEEMRALARASMLRHPAEPYLPFVTAVRASREHDDNAIPWIGATLERATSMRRRTSSWHESSLRARPRRQGLSTGWRWSRPPKCLAL